MRARSPIFVLLFTCLCVSTGMAADPSAPARDNVPRIWRALAGDRVELDGVAYGLHGVTCPSPDNDTGREAKALLNTFMLNSRYRREITCTFHRDDNVKTVDCARREQKASALMIDSGLCQLKPPSETLAYTGETLSLTRFAYAFDPVSYWRLRSCIGVHPDLVPTQCRHASRTWPLRYAEAARWLERQNFSRCPTGFQPIRSGVGPKAAHAPPNRYSLRPFLHNRCHNGSGGH